MAMWAMPFIGGGWVGAAAVAAGADVGAGIVWAAANVDRPASMASSAMRWRAVRADAIFGWVIFRSSRCGLGGFFPARGFSTTGARMPSRLMRADGAGADFEQAILAARRLV